MSIEDLKARFKRFAIEVGMLIQKLPKNTVNYAYTNQLVCFFNDIWKVVILGWVKMM